MKKIKRFFKNIKGIKVIPPAKEIIINDKKAKKVIYKGNGFYDITI